MPTLPLYRPTLQSPDAWHQVTAPGGYEWWYFDAEDTVAGLQIVVILFQGFIFHPGYLRRYFRFQKAPTRHVPPTPAEYPCAYFIVYEKGKILSQFMTQYRPEQFAASDQYPQVQIGPNTLRLDSDGSYRLDLKGVPWHLTWQGPKRPTDGLLAGELIFRPRFNRSPHERTFLSRAMTGADHQWVIAAPLCQVSGSIRIGSTESQTRLIAFNGNGYHDHNYGTAPVGPGLKRWIWGRVILEERVITFHYAMPSDRSLPTESHVIEADENGVREWPDRISVSLKSRSLGLAYPDQISIGGKLVLSQPSVVDASPFYLRLTYTAEINGRQGAAFCEVAYPHRLRWPVLGRMIEMSIDKTALTRTP